jgi:hypothetical protein
LINSEKFFGFGLEMCVNFAFFMGAGDRGDGFREKCCGTKSGQPVQLVESQLRS